MYAVTYGLPVAITRCGNFFGGGDLNWNRLFPGTIRSVLRGDAPVIRSDGSMIRDYFYIEDGALAYLALAEALHRRPELRGEAFNFSNELQLDVRAVVNRILQRIEAKLTPKILDEASNEIGHQWLSAEKARTVLGWSPSYSFDEGLDRTVAWYRSYFDV
jgi:CDP-glucose 4,6-dehydratase